MPAAILTARGPHAAAARGGGTPSVARAAPAPAPLLRGRRLPLAPAPRPVSTAAAPPETAERPRPGEKKGESSVLGRFLFSDCVRVSRLATLARRSISFVFLH
jgi:hypothetical protein